MKHTIREKGFTVLEGVLIALVIAALAAAGWWVWNQNKNDKSSSNTNGSNSKESEESSTHETADWISVTTQDGAFSMKVPDGWTLTTYPGDFLGATDVTHEPGTPAIVESSSTEYVGHSLRFRAVVAGLDDAALGPQWSSPQPGLQESTEEFSIGTLQGKRYKGVFTQDLNQTLYEYVFDLGNNKKLDVVYVVDHANGEVDDVNTVEKAIKTIDLK